MNIGGTNDLNLNRSPLSYIFSHTISLGDRQHDVEHGNMLIFISRNALISI